MDRDGIAALICLVDEGLLTQAHKEKMEEEALKRTLHRFLTPRIPSKRTRLIRQDSIWQSPFSAQYYKTHSILIARRKQQVKPKRTSHKFPAILRINKNSCKRPRRKFPIGSKQLMAFGFTVVRNTRKSHAPVGQMEFSGTKLSTAP
jgi:hypothetical protein